MGLSTRSMLRKAREWLNHADLVVLLAVLAAVVGVWVFLKVANEVTEGDTHRLDNAILLALRNPNNLKDPVGPEWLGEMGRDMTAVGGVAVLTLLSAAVVIYLLLSRKYHAALFVLVAVLGGLLLSTFLKELFSRERPQVVPHLSYVSSSSFPSGHAMLSATVYLTLGAMLARLVEQPVRKLYFLGVALLLTFLVGCSRVYLGVHYPTDVLAGWAVGLAWAVLCWLVARWLQRRGTVEKSAD